MIRHRRKCEGSFSHNCQFCGKQFHRRDLYVDHLSSNHNVVDVRRPRGAADDAADVTRQRQLSGTKAEEARLVDMSAEQVAGLIDHLAHQGNSDRAGQGQGQGAA